MARARVRVRSPTRDFALIETHEDFCVISSELPVPVYQRGEPQFSREGGDIVFDAVGAPILVRTESARVFVTLPRAPMPSGGFARWCSAAPAVAVIDR